MNCYFYVLLCWSILLPRSIHSSFQRDIEHLYQCDSLVLSNLRTNPSEKDRNFCEGIGNINSTENRIKSGRSWGKLKDIDSRRKYTDAMCNELSGGYMNPSCESRWGDERVNYWIHEGKESSCITSTHQQLISCSRGITETAICTITNAVLDFKSKASLDVDSSRNFSQGFIKIQKCSFHDQDKLSMSNLEHLNTLNIEHSSEDIQVTCSVRLKGPVYLYSHDNIDNLGHTISDHMNVWLMLWLTHSARNANTDASLLIIESLLQGGKANNEFNHSFYEHYIRLFEKVHYGINYRDHVVCIDKLILPPDPIVGFIWDGRLFETRCGQLGPSSLFQRWNLHVRHIYNIPIRVPNLLKYGNNTTSVVNVMLIDRVMRKRDFIIDPSKKVRMFTAKNKKEIIHSLSSLNNVNLTVVDLSIYSLPAQLELISQQSIIIGMHGAGIAATMHMSIGNDMCCGVIEIYPSGFRSFHKRYHFYSNSLRKMGIIYQRLDNALDVVHVDTLVSKVSVMIDKLKSKPSCVHPHVINNPFLETN